MTEQSIPSPGISRRALLAGTACLCCAGAASARIRPADMKPLVGPGYRPVDEDEKGMWRLYERVEADIAGSNLLIRDPKLNSYIAGVTERVGGPAARDLRVYVAHVPEFNAFMTPTGFMVVFSGLLTRMRNEAQLAGVLGHEAAHFLRKHSLRGYRDARAKTDFLSVLSMAAGVGGAAGGVYLGDAVQLAQLGTLFSLARNSREMEAEADAMSVALLSDARYDPAETSRVWQNLIAEIEQSARYRRKRPDRGYSLFATHPAPATRMADLRASAAEASRGVGDTGHDRYRAAIAPHRKMLLDDQVKLNDPGASLHVINTLAQDGWDGQLRYAEGEVWRHRNRPSLGDPARAAAAYAAAVQYRDAPPEAWRMHGYALLKAGQREPARQALQRYLQLAPNAPDAAMVRYSIGA